MRAHPKAFTLLELLVAVAMVALLLGLLLPALSGSRQAARTTVCAAHQRQLVTAWVLYANDHTGRAVPAGDESTPGGPAYWWGRIVDGPPARIETEGGLLSPYLSSDRGHRSVYECPAQPWGTYRPQPMSIPPPGVPTSTYGYNGYYLCPPMTPGWNLQIGAQRWKRLEDVPSPGRLLVFADALLPVSYVRNSPLLDPPMLFSAGQWTVNPYPTTAFRHPAAGSMGSAVSARADGSVHADAARPEWLTHPEIRVGSLGRENDPNYIPDWRSWR